MYGIFTNIYPINEPNVGKYTIHGASGYVSWMVHDVLIAEIGPENGRANCTGWANFQVPPLSEKPLIWKWLPTNYGHFEVNNIVQWWLKHDFKK